MFKELKIMKTNIYRTLVVKNILKNNTIMKSVDTLLTNRYPDNGTGMVRKWYGNDSRNSRLDSLSIVSRQSDLLYRSICSA